jgi:predicted ester cyclase
MSTEENKALLRRLFEEGLNQNKPGVFDELIAPDFVIYDSPLGTVRGPEGFRQLVETFRKAFPDIHVTFEQDFADGDYVIHRGYVTATHKGEFLGIPPTGKPVKLNTLDIWRVANGKAMENWVQMDLLGLMQQIGAIPAPEHSAR